MNRDKIVGQKHLLDKIDRLVESGSFPQFSLITGGYGAGKKLIADYIVDKLGAFDKLVEDMKIANVREVIEDSKNISFDKAYLFHDVDRLTVQGQNALLKLVEEPPKHCFIIMTTANKNSLLTTILSRAKELKMDMYSRAELLKFTSDPKLAKMCQTPGEIKDLQDEDMEALFKFADKIVDKIGVVSVMNALHIPSYVNVDGKDSTKFETSMLLRVICHKLQTKILDEPENRDKYLQMLKIVSSARTAYRVNAINKSALFDAMIIKLREVSRNEVERL